jgi:hypothetical protein
MNSGRGVYVMLGIVGTVAGILAISGSGGPVVGALAVGGFLALAAAVFANNRLRQLQEAIPQIAATVNATPAARAAAQRARRLSNYATDETVTDVALIVNDRDRAGRLNRRIATNVSMDEYAMQPIVKFTVPNELLNRISIIRFEIVDKAGKVQFSRAVEHYTRDGENLVACDQQLRLRDNANLGRAGTWDLQVTINGQLAAVHSFTVSPAQQDRSIPVQDDGEINISRLQEPAEEEEDMPMTLEDLLREQRRSGS